MELDEFASEPTTRAGLVAFLGALADSAELHPEHWENRNIPDFLRGWSAWLDDMDGYFAAREEPSPADPSWSLIAQMLLAARIYE